MITSPRGPFLAGGGVTRGLVRVEMSGMRHLSRAGFADPVVFYYKKYSYHGEECPLSFITNGFRLQEFSVRKELGNMGMNSLI